MNKITRTLSRIKDNGNLTGRQKYIIKATVEHLEHLEKQCCENCKHFSEGMRLGGSLWQDCEHNFDCSVIINNNFEAKDRE